MKVLLLTVLCGFCACALANYQSLGGSGLRESSTGSNQLDGNRQELSRALQNLQQLAAQNEDIQEAVGNRIAQLQAQLRSSAGLPALQAQQQLAEIRQEAHEIFLIVVRQLINGARGSNYDNVQNILGGLLGGLINSNQGYSYQGADQKEDSILDKIRKSIQATNEKILRKIQESLAQSKEINQEFRETIEAIGAQLKELAEKTGKEADRAMKAINQQISSLFQAVAKRLSQTSGSKSSYSLIGQIADIEFQQSIESQLIGQIQQAGGIETLGQQQILQQLRDQVEQQLQQLENQVYRSNALRGQYQPQIDDLREEQEALSQQSGRRAIQSYLYLQGQIRNVYNSVIQSIQGGLNYSQGQQLPGQEQGQNGQQQVQQLRQQVSGQLRQLEDLVNENAATQKQLARRISQLNSKQGSASSISGYAAIRALLSLQYQIQQAYVQAIQIIQSQPDADQEQRQQQIQQQIQQLSQQAANQLRQLQILLGQNQEIQNQLAQKLSQLLSQQQSAGQQTGYQGALALLSLQREIQQTYQAAVQRIIQQQQQEAQIEQLSQLLERQLQQLEDTLQQNAQLQAQLADQVAELRDEQQGASLLSGQQALRALLSIQRQARQLAQEARYQLQQLRQIQQLSQQVENQLQQAENIAAQNQDIQAQYANQLSQLRAQQQAASRQKGNQAIQALRSLQYRVRKVFNAIAASIQGQNY